MDHLSLYLDAADSGDLPSGWNRYAKFSLSLVYQVQNISYSIKKGNVPYIKKWDDFILKHNFAFHGLVQSFHNR